MPLRAQCEQGMLLSQIMQYSPLVHDGFVKKLQGYQIDISETRLVLVTGDALRLEPTALHIQQNQIPSYIVNLDPAVATMPYGASLPAG